MSTYVECREDLKLYLKARIPFIAIKTDERDRSLELLKELSRELNIPIYLHTLTAGSRDVASGRVVNEDRSVHGALDYASQQILQRQHFNFVLTEVPGIEDDSPVSRQLLDVVVAATERGGSIAVITSSSIWPRLQRQGMTVTLDPPNEDEMRGLIKAFLSDQPQPIEWGEAEYSEAATILAGVTRIEAENAVASLCAKGAIKNSDLDELSKVKDRIFSDISGLERVKLSSNDLEVGGLAGLHTWLDKKRKLMMKDLRARNLRQPRGVLLVGVPGCGKSLSAKAIASSWRLPLYRLDLANIHGMYVGQSESRLKEALSTADRVAPCVLWIDEIEKGLAGAGSSNDGGASTRLLGHFLFWLQEGRARIFVVATANDISKLPPELFRRGRFDELFFVDLPTPEEREEIILLYTNRYKLEPRSTEMVAELVELSDGFAGADLDAAVAEIAQTEVIAKEDGSAAAGTVVIDDHYWRSVFANIVPLSKTNPESVESIRAWGRERAIPASGQHVASEGAPKARRSVLM
jgi:SpoVK/Ycf46/Vps4 family AAA+-type ATPase